MARAAYNIKFPRFALWERRQDFVAFSLDLLIHGDGWNRNGDETPINARVTLDRTGLIRHTDYAAPEGEQETETTIGKKAARRFLRWVLNKLDVLFRDEDWSDAKIARDAGHSLLHLMPDFFPDIDWGDGDREPLCSLRLEVNRGADKVVTFYHRLPDEALALYRALVECFGEESRDRVI